jgi:hypothetical protein
MGLMANAGPRKNRFAFEEGASNCIIRNVLSLLIAQAIVQGQTIQLTPFPVDSSISWKSSPKLQKHA